MIFNQPSQSIRLAIEFLRERVGASTNSMIQNGFPFKRLRKHTKGTQCMVAYYQN